MAQQKFLIYFSSVACVFIASVAPDVGSDEVRRASGAWRERRPVFPKAQEIGDAEVCGVKEATRVYWPLDGLGTSGSNLLF
jgi:hypothetical protein